MTLKSISQIGLCAGIAAVAGFQAGHAADANPATVDGLKGYVLRVLHPGEMTSMLYRSGRVNITVDKDNKITGVSFY